MCAIGGLRLWRAGARDLRSSAARMNESMRHRGPDGEGVFAVSEFACVHRLLRIYDAETPAGPYVSRDGRWVLSFNGEIYNHEELRRELDRDGTFPWRYRSDAEILLEGWAREGAAFVSRLNGMFAFSLWDQVESCLYLGRDRVGEKPLYFYSSPEFFAFASEIRGLLALEIPRRLETEVLGDYLRYRYASGERTFFSGVEKLPPARILKIDARGEKSFLRYWEPGAKRTGGFDDLAGLISDAHRLRLPRAGLKAGLFLSGGIDSGGIASFLPRGSEALTFEAAGTEPEIFEASEIAARFGLSHERVAPALPAMEALDRALDALEEPLGDSILVPTWELARAAGARGLRIVFSGEGADEVFAGYVHHWVYQNLVRMHGLVGSRGLGWAETGLRRAPGIFAKIFSGAHPTAVGAEGLSRLADLLRSRREGGGVGSSLSALFDRPEDLLAISGGGSVRQDGENRVRSLRDLLDLDRETWLPNYTLPRLDKILMRHGIEGRLPFADHRLVEFAWGLEPSELIEGLTRKKILREALRDRVGAEVADRAKRPFVWKTPVENAEMSGWLREAPLRLVAKGLLRADRARELAERRGDDLHAKRLFSLTALDRFMELFRLGI